MRFTVSSAELLKSISIAQRAIPAKTTEAILENYLLSLEGGLLVITASDGDVTLKTELPVEGIEDGKIAIPAKLFTEFLKEVSDQPLTVGTTGDNSFECKWASGASTFPFFNPQDYPTGRTVSDGASEVNIPSFTLIDGISNTAYASSDDESRPIMNSIFFDITPEVTTLVASDLQTLVCFKAQGVEAAKECSFVLNKKHALILKGIIGKDEGLVKVVFDDKTAIFSFGVTEIVCALVVGKYPNYKSIIPENNQNILSIGRTELLNVVKRVSVCSPKSTNLIKFDVKGAGLDVSTQDLGFEVAAHDTVMCNYGGEDITIGFKAPQLVGILSNLPCENLEFRFSDGRHAALVIPEENESQKNKVFGLIMPIKVK